MNRFDSLFESMNPNVEYDFTQDEYSKLNPKGGRLYVKGTNNDYSIPLARRFDIEDLVRNAERETKKRSHPNDYTITVLSKGQEVPILKKSHGDEKWSRA